MQNDKPELNTILTEAEASGLDALIAEVDRRVRTPGIYTSQEATEFVRQWEARRDEKPPCAAGKSDTAAETASAKQA